MDEEEVEEEVTYLLSAHHPQPNYQSTATLRSSNPNANHHPHNHITTTTTNKFIGEGDEEEEDEEEEGSDEDEEIQTPSSTFTILEPEPELKASLWRTATTTMPNGYGDENGSDNSQQQEHLLTALKESISRQYGHDDIVTISVKQMMFALVGTILCWLFSYLLVMIQIISHETYFTYNWLLFLPMWIGSIIGLMNCLMITCKLCKTPIQLMTKDRRLLLRYRGIEQEQIEKHSLVDLESLPLMRSLFFISIVLITSFLLLFITQLLLYLWFVDVLALWHAIVPLKILLIGYLLYMYLVKVFSLRSCLLLTLASIQLTLFISREEHSQIQAIPWLYLASPLWIIIIFSLYKHITSLIGYKRGHLLLTISQAVALYGYLLSTMIILCSTIAMILHEEYYMKQDLLITISYLGWTIAVPIFTLCGVLVLLGEGSKLVETRGYSQPTVLARTSQGWMATTLGGNSKGIWLLGNVKVKLPSPVDLTRLNRNSNVTVKPSNAKDSSTTHHQHSGSSNNGMHIPLYSKLCSSGSRDDASYDSPALLALQAEWLGIANSSEDNNGSSASITAPNSSIKPRVKKSNAYTDEDDSLIEKQIELSPLGAYREV